MIEDQEDVREMVVEYLRMSGFDTIDAEDGRKGLDMLALKPDVITLDLIMPRMDGWAFLDHVQRLESVPPIILCTSISPDRVPSGYPVFMKGSNPELLIRCVREVLASLEHVDETISSS